MWYVKPVCGLAIAILGLALLSDIAASQTRSRAAVQAPTVIAHSTDLSEREATLRVTLSNGDSYAVSFSRGVVFLNGGEVANYESGGALERAWRGLLGRAAQINPNDLVSAIREWSRDNVSDETAEALAARLAPLAVEPAGPGPTAFVPGAPRAPREQRLERTFASPIDLSGLEALEGLKALEGLEALEDLAALEALKGLDVDALRAEINEQLNAVRTSAAESVLSEVYVPAATGQVVPSVMSHLAGDLAGLLAAFVAMCALGFGLVFFASRQLEVVADTVRHAFWRSLLVGLLAQPLVLPLFGLLMLGLTLTVVGILAIPFAALAFAAAAILGVFGGYLAVARTIGEAYLRRRMSLGHRVGGWLSYRYMVYGLLALFTIWLPAALLGWAPVAGEIFAVSAMLLSWIIATAGFGATILSRAGIRGTFTRQFDQSLSDEYLYRTPQATPVARPPQRRDRLEP
jgi:hypothetical protein